MAAREPVGDFVLSGPGCVNYFLCLKLCLKWIIVSHWFATLGQLIVIVRLQRQGRKEKKVDTYYIDGEFLGEDEARVSVKDLAVLRGFGVFDYMITYNKRPFHLEDHVARLENSAREIGLKLNKSGDQICGIVRETLARNSHHKESGIRLLHTGGVSDDGVSPRDNGIFMVMASPRQPMDQALYTQGASVITVDMERFKPTAKSTNYLSAVFALAQAKKEGAIEALYLGRDGQVLEGTTSNFFAVVDDTLITPGEGILPGVTRNVVRDLVQAEFRLELNRVDLADFSKMDELFLTSSNKEVMPVVRVNGRPVGTGRPGKITRTVMDMFKAYTIGYGKG